MRTRTHKSSFNEYKIYNRGIVKTNHFKFLLSKGEYPQLLCYKVLKHQCLKVASIQNLTVSQAYPHDLFREYKYNDQNYRLQHPYLL